MIEKGTFDDIIGVWSDHLWKERKTPIESHSAMLFKEDFDLQNFKFSATYFLYKINGEIAGVNSGHKCIDNTYRSRGLYVFPEYRRQGIGKKLLINTVEQGKLENCILVWSYPRLESWNTYKSAGFELCSDWTKGETGINAFCKINI